MRLFEILMMAANAILLIKIVFAGRSRKGGLAEISSESENTWVINPDALSSEVASSGMKNFWVRGSWAGCPQPVRQETRSGAAGIVLPFLPMAFAIISILSEGILAVCLAICFTISCSTLLASNIDNTGMG